MKRFLMVVLQKALILAVGYALLFVIGIVLLWYTLQSFERKPSPLRSGSVLVINLALDVPDAPRQSGLSEIVGEALGAGQSIRSVPLRHFTEALRMARTDKRIEAVVLHGNFKPLGYGSGFAALEELRDELMAFREVNKPVIAYLERPGLRELFLTSAADKVWLNPYSELNLSGISITTPFFAEALERMGIGIQTLRAGDYKSALEPFTERQLSAENRAQLKALTTDLWQHLSLAIIKSRDLPVDFNLSHKGLNGSGLYFPDQAVASGLVDGLLYFDQFLESVQLTGINARPQVTIERYISEWENHLAKQQGDAGQATIAVVYLEGDLVDVGGHSDSVGADFFARELRELQQRQDIVAVVIRVNSPGGSATAAETLHREISRLAATRPVIVSFGSIAASGGYWLATPAHKIVMAPAGLTGSIGVFGVTMNLDEAADRFGIGFETVRTSPFADITSLVRPREQHEMVILQTFVDALYEDFLQRVEMGRSLQRNEVEAVAGGRIFLAPYAVANHLGDRLGGLGDAIEEAAKMVNFGVEDLRIEEIPAKELPIATLVRLLEGDDPHLGQLVQLAKVSGTPPWLETARRLTQTLARSQSPQARLPFDWFPQ